MSEVPLYRSTTGSTRPDLLFQGWLVFKAHRWLYHSTLGSTVIKQKKKTRPAARAQQRVDVALRDRRLVHLQVGEGILQVGHGVVQRLEIALRDRRLVHHPEILGMVVQLLLELQQRSGVEEDLMRHRLGSGVH